MRNLYRHRQIGWTIIIVVGLAALFAAAASLATPWPTSLLVIAALILTGLLFSSLTIEVTASELVWSFGPGFLKKRVALSGIASAAPARNKWWWGWGVISRHAAGSTMSMGLQPSRSCRGTANRFGWARTSRRCWLKPWDLPRGKACA